MEAAIQMFKFDGENIRIILDNEGTPHWVAVDIADSLGYSWAGSATIKHVPEQWRGVNSVQTPSGIQQMITLTEQGVFFFLARSDKKKALPMQLWIANDVLPSIMRTGHYSTKPLSTVEMFALQAQINLENEQRFNALEIEVRQLKQEKETARQALLALPEPTVEAPDKSTRAALNACVRSYVQRSGGLFPDVWRTIYKELKYRAGFDAVTRAKNSGKSPLDEVEAAGLLPELYAIAREVLK